MEPDFKGPPASTASKRASTCTSCVTCKARKIKCSREQPRCKRCTDSGRRCDGYATTTFQVKRAATVKEWRAVTFDPGMAVEKLLSYELAAEERHWLRYFSSTIGPALTGITDEEFWSKTLPQMSVSSSPVRHSLLALASSCLHIQAKSTSHHHLQAQNRELSIKHYSLAIRDLKDMTSTTAFINTTEIVLICCVVFIALECLWGNESQMISHLSNGVNILKADFKQEAPKTAVRGKLEDIFDRLDAFSSLFSREATLKCADYDDFLEPVHQYALNNLVQAKEAFDTLHCTALAFVGAVYGGTVKDCLAGNSSEKVQQTLVNGLQDWEAALFDLASRLPTNRNSIAQQIRMLRIRYESTVIFLSTCFSDGEEAYNDLASRFETIVDLATAVVAADAASLSDTLTTLGIHGPSGSPSLPTFSLDCTMVPALFLTATKCRVPKIRHRAINLLEQKGRFRDSLWDAKLLGMAARRIVEVEEAGISSRRLCVQRTEGIRLSEEPVLGLKATFHATDIDTQQPMIWEEELFL